MQLIIGGAYQGKLAYAQERYGIRDGWIDGSVCEFHEIETCRGIYQFHELIRRIQTSGQEVQKQNQTKEYMQNYGTNLLPDWMCGLQTDHALQLEYEADKFVKTLLKKNPEIIIVTNELGCGVVPVERKDRIWRETTGRVCTCLAQAADEVIRVICGMGMKLK